MSCCGFDPSASATQISSGAPERSDPNTSRRPSGDKRGSCSRHARPKDQLHRTPDFEAVEVSVERTRVRTPAGRATARWLAHAPRPLRPQCARASGSRQPLRARDSSRASRRGVYHRAPVTSPREGIDKQRPLRRESPRGHRRRVRRIQFDDIDIAESRQTRRVLARLHDAYASRRPSGANAGS